MIKKLTSMTAFGWVGIAQIILLIAWANFGGRFSAYPSIRTVAICEYCAYFALAAVWVFFAQLMRKREVAIGPAKILCSIFVVLILVAVSLIRWSKGSLQTLPALMPLLLIAAIAAGSLLSQLRRKTQGQKPDFGSVAKA